MNRNFDRSFDWVLQSEGGFSDSIGDPGGATKYGCTKSTWEMYVGHEVSIDDMKNLTPEQIKPLYKTRYWDAIHGDALPSGLDYCLFDACINSGNVRASKWIQEIVGVPADGAIGNNTLAAISQIKTVTLINEYCDKRLEFLKTLKLWPIFGDGWNKRVAQVKIRALELV